MKKAICILLAIIVLFAGLNMTVFAQGAEISIQDPSLFLLRAGGGGGGGSSGGSGGGGGSGSTTPGRFVEYWQFIRKEDTWVLHKILQKDESDQIAFSE